MSDYYFSDVLDVLDYLEDLDSESDDSEYLERFERKIHVSFESLENRFKKYYSNKFKERM